MAKSAEEVHLDCMNRFIDLANTLKNEGVEKNIVSSGLMTASAVYATYSAVGNTGGLTDSGVDKVLGAYRQHLERVQRYRKDEDNRRRSEAERQD